MANVEVIDFRSDTVTKPTPGMRKAIAEAEVGDDVLGEDPTVNRLEARMAELFGKEAAVFVTTGTQANQTAIRAHTRPGEEIIGAEASHFYRYESGGAAVMSGCSVCLIDAPRGVFSGDDVRASIRPDDQHYPVSRLVVVENTQNRGVGKVWPMETIRSVHQAAKEHNLLMHMDGARIWNACVASGYKPIDYTRYFDSVAACFSKGLGAPAGSIVAGDKAFIVRARRARKMMGGAMRQAGILAAAAIYAVDHHIERLAEDHANARRLAEAIAELPRMILDPKIVESNIVIFDVEPRLGTGADIVAQMNQIGIKMLAVAPQKVRALTHLDVSAVQTDEAIRRLRERFGRKQ
jgi:threonine aldolase